jgi:hypothetical protein
MKTEPPPVFILVGADHLLSPILYADQILALLSLSWAHTPLPTSFPVFNVGQ